MTHLTLRSALCLWLFAFGLSGAARTSPTFTVEALPSPPSKFKTQQIDGMDVLPDGRLAVCLPSGEVFFYQPADQSWALFAEGLHNPLGLIALATNELIIAQRPELTRVRDTDGDGRADDFEVVTDQFGMSGNYHEFNFTPVSDGKGGYYFGLGTGSQGDGVRAIVRGAFNDRARAGRMHASTPFRGCIMHHSPEGVTRPFAFGVRTPNGLGTDLKGNLFVTDNQGDWVGSSKLFHIQDGRFYGHAASLVWKDGFEGVPIETPVETLAKMRSRACVVFPHGSMANSPTKVMAIPPEAKVGPFTGQLLVGEMNKARIMRVMLERVGGELQGACVPFFDGSPLRTGCNRMAWAPDGSLYVGHTKHSWAGNRGINHIRWNGEIPFEIQNMEITEDGFHFTFTKPIDVETAKKPETWPFERYYYRYHQSYGSKPFDLVKVPVESVRISEDAKEVTIKLEELRAWHVHQTVVQNLKAADGTPLTNRYIAYTVNRLLSDTPDEPLQTSE